MNLAHKLERLARLIPGVAEYQDRERRRDTDKTVRQRLAEALGQLGREVESVQRRLMENGQLSPLPRLERLAAKLDKLRNLVPFASRGYRGLFDTDTLDQAGLARLYRFDVGLRDELMYLETCTAQLCKNQDDPAGLSQAINQLDQALDRFERVFAKRQDVLTA